MERRILTLRKIGQRETPLEATETTSWRESGQKSRDRSRMRDTGAVENMLLEQISPLKLIVTDRLAYPRNFGRAEAFSSAVRHAPGPFANNALRGVPGESNPVCLEKFFVVCGARGQNLLAGRLGSVSTDQITDQRTLLKRTIL
jgi:hypothetical protein